MPPVPWKQSIIVAVLLIQILPATDAQQSSQDAISISSDGWRPILGTKRHPPGFESQQVNGKSPSKTGDGITQYKNPIKNFEIIKAEVTAETTTLPPTTFQHNQPNKAVFKKQAGKPKYHAKPTGPYITLPGGSHGPHIPIGASSHGTRHGQPMKKPFTLVNKAQHASQVKRKPVRGQAIAHSTRDEVFVPPPPNTGAFSYSKLAPSNVKTREAQGVGLPGGNHFSINQPNSHIEFTNRFALPDENIFQRPVPTFFFAKPPSKFKSQNDEYTRNLVPPPPRFQQDKDKLKTAQTVKENVVPVTEPIIKFSDFSVKPGRFNGRPSFVDNLAVQVPPPFEQNFQFSQLNTNKNREQAVDVQVTRENIKQFNSRPNGFPSHIDYVDYDFHTVPKPAELPKLQTYEVTEGKFVDNRNPFQYSFQSSILQPQKIQKIESARPGLLFQGSSSSRPIFNTAPLVELNVPQFLPTPYKPEGVLPTSPTQSEVSTIFTQLSTKMNKYKQDALHQNPLFFNIQEVSTHYPILGKPEIISDTSTDVPFPMKENGEITNEITSIKEPEKDIVPTEAVPDRDPTKTRVTQRRRQRPRRPSTTTSTTSTTEVAQTEQNEPIKTQENEETSIEGQEKPYRRKRPRPTRYRTRPGSQENGERQKDRLKDSEEGQNSVRDSEERRQSYRPNSSAAEDTEAKNRGRYRFRQRGQSNERVNEIRNPSKRRRIRPTSVETPANHKEENADTSESYEINKSSFMEEPSNENSGMDSMMIEDMSINNEEEQNKGILLSAPNQETVTFQYESTNKPIIEEVQITERVQPYERTTLPMTSTNSDHLVSTIVHLPENEVDYSTAQPSSTSSSNFDDSEQLNLATTLPITTTTTEVTTAKGIRIRGRPMKQDLPNRPRFSVKDYRQRLTQYTTSAAPASTDLPKTTTENNLRLRFLNRLRTRPTPNPTTTTVANTIEEEVTELPPLRTRFRPKEPRHQVTTESEMIITENNVKAVNTRLRPFGRQRSTTEASTTAKVSIKPNLFSAARRRSKYPSLKSRIQNRLKKNETAEENTTESDIDVAEPPHTTEPFESLPSEVSTEGKDRVITELTEPQDETIIEELTTEVDISKNDALIYSQRVSDLTSSSKNEYDTPGVFKSVSPTSRRIPNYFTISTDDPILPIEAFFPNLKEKERGSKS